MNAFEAAAANGCETTLQGELDELFNEQNAGPRKGCHLLPPRSLRVTVAL